MRRLGALLAAFALLLPHAAGQAQLTGRILGRVSDKDGHPVAGATITVRSAALQGERRAASNQHGEFVFALLPVGRYELTVTASDLRATELSLDLRLGQSVPVDITLQARADLVEEVTVVGAPSRLETTAGGENFPLDSLVEELPIQDRSIESIADYAPNIAPGPNRSPRISGANAFDTVVLLDGAEISDPYFGSAAPLYIEDALEEIQVQTSGISARYGRFQGGVLNAVTRKGGNEFSGTLRTELSNESWNSRTRFGESQSSETSWRALGTLGGYLMRDRLWFFLAGWYEPETEQTVSALADQSFANRRDERRWQYKLRGALTPDHVVEAGVFDQNVSQTGYAGLPAGEGRARGLRDDPRRTYTFSYQGIVSPRLFVDFQATRKDVEIRGGGLSAQGSPFLEQNDFRVYHNHWWDYADPESRDNRTASLNVTFAPGREHTVEGGVQWIRSRTGGQNRQSPTGLNLVADADLSDFVVRYQGGDAGAAFYDPARAGEPVLHADGEVHFNLYPGQGEFERWEALPFDARAFVDYTALYLQESWQRGPLRIDLGLRWERYEGDDSLGLQTASTSDFAPRAAVTWEFAPRWQLQATWGRYLARINDATTNNASGVASAPRSERTGYLGPPLFNVTGDAIDSVLADESLWGPVTGYFSPRLGTQVTAPDLRNAYADDLNLALKTALPHGRGWLELRAVSRDFSRLIDDFRGGAYESVVEIDPDGDGTALATVDRIVWDNAEDARRRYGALAVSFAYRPAERWNLGGNYTFARLSGNYTGEEVNQPAIGSPVGDYPQSIPSAGRPDGRLPGDITHRLRLWGNYRTDLPRLGRLSLGGVLRFSSGDVWSRAAEVQVFVDDPQAVNDTDTFYTHFFEPRGANRFPSSWAIDGSARLAFPLGRDFEGWLKLDITNLFDRDHELSFNTAGSAITVPGELRDPSGNLVLDETGQPIPVEIPVGFMPGPQFGRVDGPESYQLPRTVLITAGVAWN